MIYGGLFLALVGIGFVGCEKEQIPENITNDNNDNSITRVLKPTDYIGVSTDGRMLVFENSEKYNSLVSNLDSAFIVNFYPDMVALDYQALKESSLEKSNNIGVDDEFLASLLNQDNIMQIGDYLYRVNKSKESVYVLAAEHFNQYTDLVNENLNNENVREYSTNEDVVELVEAGLDSEEKLFCGDRKAKSKTEVSESQDTGNNTSMYLFVKYKRFGVYFSLMAEGYRTTNSSQFGYWYQIDNSSWSKRCGSSVSNYSHPWRTGNGYNVFGSPVLYSDVFRFYSGSKQLKNYRYRVRLRCENNNIPTSTQSYTTYFTDYVLIQDY